MPEAIYTIANFGRRYYPMTDGRYIGADGHAEENINFALSFKSWDAARAFIADLQGN